MDPALAGRGLRGALEGRVQLVDNLDLFLLGGDLLSERVILGVLLVPGCRFLGRLVNLSVGDPLLFAQCLELIVVYLGELYDALRADFYVGSLVSSVNDLTFRGMGLAEILDRDLVSALVFEPVEFLPLPYLFLGLLPVLDHGRGRGVLHDRFRAVRGYLSPLVVYQRRIGDKGGRNLCLGDVLRLRETAIGRFLDPLRSTSLGAPESFLGGVFRLVQPQVILVDLFG